MTCSWRLLCILILSTTSLWADGPVPALYQGRFRPLDVVSRLWLYEHYHRQQPREELAYDNAEELLWELHFNGQQGLEKAPLFWIHRAELKQLLGLPLRQDRFSMTRLGKSFASPQQRPELWQRVMTQQFLTKYHAPSNRSRAEMLELDQLSPGLWLAIRNNELRVIAPGTTAPWDQLEAGSLVHGQIRDLSPRDAKRDQALVDEALELMGKLEAFRQLGVADQGMEHELYEDLLAEGLNTRDIHQQLEAQYPLSQRLQRAGSLIQVLPSRLVAGQWLSLHALDVQSYDATQDRWVPVPNFTLYSDTTFAALREAHQEQDIPELKRLLSEAYPEIAGAVYRKARSKTLSYPSVTQLKAEQFYYKTPLIELCILIYLLAALVLGFGLSLPKPGLERLGTVLMLGALSAHSAVLGLRIFILERPPVANMFETVIYVPWVTMIASLFLRWRSGRSSLLLSGAIASVALLILLRLTNVSAGMENVQAVLDSQYWLTVHVLMIVASYGVFVLAGTLAHIYLLPFLTGRPRDEDRQRFLARSVLQGLYLGTALLIPATILGGVWAAESWGRFWDWDPKESWAFISSCVYLVGIHAYRYRRIGDRGLAIMAVIGLMSISFTWYGVNYILGTGLHSYGFGSGGESWYYLYLAAETALIAIVLGRSYVSSQQHTTTGKQAH